MAVISYEISPSVLSALRMTPTELTRELKLAACAQWYAQGLVSQGKAAEIAGLSRAEFLSEISRRNVPICQVTEDELSQELEYLRANRRRRVASDSARQL